MHEADGLNSGDCNRDKDTTSSYGGDLIAVEAGDGRGWFCIL